MSRYRKTSSNGVIRIADGAVIPVAPGNRDYDEYIASGETPDPALPDPPPPTVDQIYDATLFNSQVLKALVLALNDGSFVPGSSKTGLQLKAIIKAKM